MSAALELTEKQWDAQLFSTKDGLATMLGWTLCYHTLRSKGSQPGFPDRVIVRDRVIFAELKREKGKPTERQIAWLDGLARAGAEVYLWQPSDLDEIGQILSTRWGFFEWRPGPPDVARPPHLATLRLGPFEAGSAWVPGTGRLDSVSQLDLAC